MAPADSTILQLPNISNECEGNNSILASDSEHISHQVHQNEIEVVDLSSETTERVAPVLEVPEENGNNDLSVDLGATIQKIVEQCQQSQITNNSVEILRCMQKHLVLGRAFHGQKPHEV